jgi:hypothetical protein
MSVGRASNSALLLRCLLDEVGVYGSGPWTVDVEADPWTLRGPLVADIFGEGRLTLERVSDRWDPP